MTLADDPGFALLVRRLEGQGVPALRMYKDRCLQRRLSVRMRACGVRTLTEYVGKLDERPGEVARLLEALTINVTRFFRNLESWDRLAAALPDAARARGGRLDAWSAGCASGEEAYTLAMLLAEVCELRALRVDATDVDEPSLAVARAAWYRPAAFEEAPRTLVDRWTAVDGDGRRVREELRRRVRVLRHDLGAAGAPDPPYDLIVCRNVVIYFERETQQRLYTTFADALRPGGLLLLGKVELLYGPARDRFQAVDARERMYRSVSA